MGVCMPGLCVIACVTCVMLCDVDQWQWVLLATLAKLTNAYLYVVYQWVNVSTGW